MVEELVSIQAARRATLNVANSLVMTAMGALGAGDVEFADTIIITVMRVLDAYEAVTQLGVERKATARPQVANRVHPVRDRDA